MKEYWVNVFLNTSNINNKPYCGYQEHPTKDRAIRSAKEGAKNVPCIYRIHVKMKEPPTSKYEPREILTKMFERNCQQ